MPCEAKDSQTDKGMVYANKYLRSFKMNVLLIWVNAQKRQFSAFLGKHPKTQKRPDRKS